MANKVRSELWVKPVNASLLKHLKATHRQAKTITLIVDNSIIDKSRETQRCLTKNPKFRVINQPVYSPWVNQVCRLWQALHDIITRSHKFSPMWQLVNKIHHCMETVSPSPGGRHGLAKDNIIRRSYSGLRSAT